MWFLLIFDDVADTFSAAFLKQGSIKNKHSFPKNAL